MADRARGGHRAPTRDWAQLVDKAFSHFVEPELIQPTIVLRLPDRDLAVRPGHGRRPALTERFEYFAGGMELGNAFSEINDAATQQARFEMQAGCGRRRAGRPGLRRGALLRDAADGRARLRDRPARDAAERPRHDPRRRAVPCASLRAELEPARSGAAALERDHVGEDVVEDRVGLPSRSRPRSSSVDGIRCSMSSIPCS